MRDAQVELAVDGPGAPVPLPVRLRLVSRPLWGPNGGLQVGVAERKPALATREMVVHEGPDLWEADIVAPRVSGARPGVFAERAGADEILWKQEVVYAVAETAIQEAVALVLFQKKQEFLPRLS